MKKFETIENMKIKLFDINEVDEITLLTIEQAKKIPYHILCCDEWWWLQSPGYTQNIAAIVTDYGDVYKTGDYVHLDNTGVRPAFKINNLESKKRDKVMIGKTLCTVVGKGLVLADYSICEHRFDEKSNEWETSELKKFMSSKEFISLL